MESPKTCTDVEVTPQMIEAGVSAFEEFSETSPAYLLVQILYNAMREAQSDASRHTALKPHKPNDEKAPKEKTCG